MRVFRPGRSVALLLLVVLVGAACTNPPPPPPPPPPLAAPPWVKAIYARPSDRPYRADYATAVDGAINEVQAWFSGQAGETFARATEPVRNCVLPQVAEYYRTDSWWRIQSDLQSCAPVGPLSSETTWVVYVDVIDVCGPGRIGAGAIGLTMLPRADLQGLVGEPQVDRCGMVETQPRSRWIGGLAHEIAHTFGVSHPPGCEQGLPTCDTNSVMWWGYVRYPDTYLSEAERTTLRASPFIR